MAGNSMLQVNRKKTPKRRKWIPALVLAILAAVGGLAVWYAVREPEPMPTREDTRGSLIERETSELVRARIQMKDREPWTVVRNDAGELVIEGADAWTVDESLGERVEDALANLVYEDILTENPADYRDRLEEFGLAEPALTAEAEFSDGQKYTIRIGDDSGMADEDFRYMTMDGDDRLYAVAGNLMEDLGIEQELLHPVAQPEIQTSRVDRITVRDGAGTVTAEWTLRGAVTDSDAAENWMLTSPVTYPADPDQTEGLIKNAGSLRLGLYIGPATDELLSECGLTTPTREIEIHMAAGATGQITDAGAYNVRDWPEETVRFLLGGARNELTDYCLYEGTVYTINHFTAAAITETDPIGTLARSLVPVATDHLGSLRIDRADGTRDEYILTYTSEPLSEEEIEENGDGETSRVVVTCEKNGEEIPYTVFEADYERMRVVNVSGRLPDGWEKKETRERYVFRTVSGTEHTVELSAFDAMHDAVTVDGCTLFYLIRGGMGEMP